MLVAPDKDRGQACGPGVWEDAVATFRNPEAVCFRELGQAFGGWKADVPGGIQTMPMLAEQMCFPGVKVRDGEMYDPIWPQELVPEAESRVEIGKVFEHEVSGDNIDHSLKGISGLGQIAVDLASQLIAYLPGLRGRGLEPESTPHLAMDRLQVGAATAAEVHQCFSDSRGSRYEIYSPDHEPTGQGKELSPRVVHRIAHGVEKRGVGRNRHLLDKLTFLTYPIVYNVWGTQVKIFAPCEP